MENETNVPESLGERKKPFILFEIWQWMVAAIIAIFVIVMLGECDKLNLPGVPEKLFWIAVAATVATVILHSPPLYFRLPTKGKLAAYLAIIPALILLGSALGGVQEVYEKTPAGAKELAARQAAKNAEAEQRKAEQALSELQHAADAEQKAAEATAGRQDQRLENCKNLIPQISDMAKTEKNLEFLETNYVSADATETTENPLTCYLEAITSRGSFRVKYGLERSPQGLMILNMRIN